MTAKIEEILNLFDFFLNRSVTDLTKHSEYFTSLKVFTRRRKLTFVRLCYFLVTQPRRSLSVELDSFFCQLNESVCTKSAFSKSRYKVKPAFFKAWSTYLIGIIYRVFAHDIKRWHGFRLKAVDGTTLYLFDAPGIMSEFGGAENQYGKIPMARAVFETDVLNGFCTQANLGSYHKDETALASGFLDNSRTDDLIIYDRWFPSYELIYRHLHKDIPLLMRCRAAFNTPVKNFVGSGSREAIVNFKITPTALAVLTGEGFDVGKNDTLTVRLLRMDIGQRAPEILITTLVRTDTYKYDAFKELYFLRWNVETFIDKMKNKLQTEIFSGHKAEAVYQDFHATVIAANIHATMDFACNPYLDKINDAHKEKEQAEQKINQNVTIGILKHSAVKLFLLPNKSETIKTVLEKFESQLIRIIPGRQKPRRKKQKNKLGKYNTFTNYRKCL